MRVMTARELAVCRLLYIAFVKVTDDSVIVLNVGHTAREFPARH